MNLVQSQFGFHRFWRQLQRRSWEGFENFRWSKARSSSIEKVVRECSEALGQSPVKFNAVQKYREDAQGLLEEVAVQRQKVPEEVQTVPEKVWEALVQSHIRGSIGFRRRFKGS